MGPVEGKVMREMENITKSGDWLIVPDTLHFYDD
jgi:hypothetical protein